MNHPNAPHGFLSFWHTMRSVVLEALNGPCAADCRSATHQTNSLHYGGGRTPRRSVAPRVALLLFVVTASLSAAPATERVYISGRDKDNTVPWKFFCTSGANSGVWTNLPVPSQWDMKGFGTLTYKKDATNAWGERGLYEHDFAIPAAWKDKRVFLVFEGVMTDTSAKLNGESVGPTHQGSFYRFKYEVTKLAKFGATNRLEVDVARHSANESVNKAERLADFWVFAGIYRPVYLEAVPQEFIERVAIDAKADGDFTMDVFADGAKAGDSAEAQVMTLEGKAAGGGFAGKPLTPAHSPSEGERGTENRTPNRLKAELRTKIPSPRQWTAETPNLYDVEVRLKRGGEVLHTYKQRFGFRTMEVRDGDGLYVNGRKIILKGVNRHSFWPDSGRCLSEAVHRLDINTIKDMNGNAVRMSHYPPDVEFLDMCDELGLYVLDELAGWHNNYDNEIGPKLVEAMVTRDVNHPSILLWDNGNEGGFNRTLDPLFAKFDPQQRRVLHPWAVFSGINTAHYLAYSNAEVAALGEPMQYNDKAKAEVLNTNLPNKLIYMPTEFMHGLYDGGAAAGLADYWGMMMSHSNCAGGFIWALLDEAVKRPDTGELDAAGNQAPDGIVGPYREREASFYAIKQLWSPIKAWKGNSGKFTIRNEFNFTALKGSNLVWQQQRYCTPDKPGHGFEVVRQQTAPLDFTVMPGFSSPCTSPANWQLSDGDALSLRATAADGRELRTWVFPSDEASKDNGATSSHMTRSGSSDTNTITLSSGLIKASFSRASGKLVDVQSGLDHFSFTNGPRGLSGTGTLISISNHWQTEPFDMDVRSQYSGPLKTVTWRFNKGGWLECNYTYTASGTNDAIGVLFDYPENLVKHKRWLGDGPYRVWKNRLGGGTLGVWENDCNNTITGYRGWVYPEFKGFFANVRWLQLETTEGLITVVPENIPFVQVLTPEFPPDNLVANAKVSVPQCGLGFLHAIPAIGSKFKGPESTGPQGQPNIGQGEYSGTVSFYFGELP